MHRYGFLLLSCMHMLVEALSIHVRLLTINYRIYKEGFLWVRRFWFTVRFRDVGSYQKLGGQVVMWGHNLPPLVNKGLRDLQKPARAIVLTTHPSPTSLPCTLHNLSKMIGTFLCFLQSHLGMHVYYGNTGCGVFKRGVQN